MQTGNGIRIHHIAVWTMDLEIMRRFYEHYFGAVSGEKYRNNAKGFESYFLSLGNGAGLELMKLDRMQTGKITTTEMPGLAHIALSMGSRIRVDELTEILRNEGYTIAGEPRTTGDGFYESVILDPEGNRVELTE